MTLPIAGRGSLFLKFFMIVMLGPSSIQFLAKNEPIFYKSRHVSFS